MRKLKNLNDAETVNNFLKKEVNTVDTFLKFCYNFPFDIKERFIEYYGESLGNHFHKKFEGYTIKRENSFFGMVEMYQNMTTNNQIIFMEIVNDYYK